MIGILICIPSFPTDSDQPTQFYTLKGGQCLVRVVTGCLVGTLEGDTQQDQLVPSKVITYLLRLN